MAALLRVLLAVSCFATTLTWADSPEALLDWYATLARQSDPEFQGFSADRGNAFYNRAVAGPNGEHSCALCHSPDPKETVFGHSGAIRAECAACHVGGMPRPADRGHIRRDIEPMAPSANPDRFTNPGKSELWFDVNCFYVLGRACSAREKGDFLAYLLSVR